MAEETNKDNTITLTKFKPREYRAWATTACATFGVRGVLDIVEGKELNPTPINPDGTVAAINVQLRARILKWQRNHELAREALLKSLEPAEVIKLGTAQNSAPAIWERLRNRYGQILDIKYVKALREFHSLEKDEKMPM